ncbi:uncharacterized protein TNCV_4153531 [Trichonephila clavipes]|nr:uncharacterized protein TNCV_4153531 [Trichonephila clavipes]
MTTTGREITDFVQSIPGFQECDEEYVETWMAYDAEDCGFQMLNGEEVVTFVQEESEPVDDETDEDEDNNNRSRGIVEARVHQMLTRFLRWRQQSECCPIQLLLLKRIRDLAAKTKSLVYADKPQTLDHLEDNIRRVIADIRPQMLEKVIENWTSRLDYIRASRGSPMPEIIFKM